MSYVHKQLRNVSEEYVGVHCTALIFFSLEKLKIKKAVKKS